ncbi:5' nucleotidase, NT5C type [Cohnella terricola]|uniref:5'-3'-deoxyribonucleotidase n=1 Tax=Cohnella terricola TaxID=1289167 RepID=A0A559JT87_9BACL|nr:5'-3'-deoxyribonucleotidase [Cohnella terricola]TVY03098.1 5'-3'-deoxyribonucleotidase [Cohnella terricola]
MKRIAIDMDEVMADTVATHLEWYNRDYQDNLHLTDLHGKTLLQLRPQRTREIESYYGKENFFRELKVIEHSQEVIRELSHFYEIYITTAAMEVPASFKAKYEWLLEHFSFLDQMNFVFCGNKSIIHADYLIDDNVKQLDRFRGKGILYTAPHNILETGYVRVNNWPEVREFFIDRERLIDGIEIEREVK